LQQCFPELEEEDAMKEAKKAKGEAVMDNDDEDSDDGQFPVLNIVTVINITEKPVC